MHRSLAAAFVRGHRPDAPDLSDEELIAWGERQGLRLHKFKDLALPRVDKVLGWLRGLAPRDLVDVGSGRGAFLWPLLDAFPDLSVTAVDDHPIRARDLRAIAAGGVSRLIAVEVDAAALDLHPPRDGATLLEVLEHVEDPRAVLAAVVRSVERFVVVSVPSDPDENPDHRRLFTVASLEEVLRDAGLRRIQHDRVRGHHLALGFR